MKTGSKTSKPSARLSKAGTEADRLRAAELRRMRRQHYKMFAPPDVPSRRREARRWMDKVEVLTLNGRVCERRPGERLHTVTEMIAMMEALERALRTRDPELYRAVQRLMFENGARKIGITFEAWQRLSHRRRKRTAKVRSDMIRAGVI